MSVTVVSSAEELVEHVAAWEDLVTAAVEPNVFYEPFMLLPALRAFGAGLDLSFALVWGTTPSPTGPRRALHGIFPLIRQPSSRALPLRTLGCWIHDYVFLTAPLIRTDSPVACLRTFFDWVCSERGDTDCIELTDVSGDGPFWHHLTEYLNESGRTTWIASSHTRAVFRPRGGDAESYLREAITGKHRKELRRQARVLSEAGEGPVSFAKLGATDDLGRWLEDFLRLEASGWKGRRGTAMGVNTVHRRFFEEMALGAFERGRLHMLSLAVGSRVIAAKFNLLAGQGGGFAFKIAFDEQFGRYSPGVHLEMKTIEDLFNAKVSWMDSCASAEHPMINRLWLERRVINSIFISTGKRGDLVLSMMPIMRFMKREIANRKREKAMISKDEPVGGTPVAKTASEPLSIDAGEFAATFSRKPFLLRHNLSDHPLFKLPRLIELAKRMPASDVEYNSGNLPVSQDPTKTPQNGLSIEETVRRIEECQSWMVLKDVEKDPEYRALLDRCLDQVSWHSQHIAPGMRSRSAFIFVTSPGSVTPYHMDPEHNFLLQIRGKKEMHVFDGNDRSILSEADLERYFGGAHRNLHFKDEYQAKAWTFRLTPGMAVHVPVTFPHWVKNGDEVSISFSITFRTPSSDRRAAVYRMNSMLRRFPLRPQPYAGAGWRDSVKYGAYRAVQYAEKMADVVTQRRPRADKGARY